MKPRNSVPALNSHVNTALTASTTMISGNSFIASFKIYADVKCVSTHTQTWKHQSYGHTCSCPLVHDTDIRYERLRSYASPVSCTELEQFELSRIIKGYCLSIAVKCVCSVVYHWSVIKLIKYTLNDPSAGSPTDALLRLLFPLDHTVRLSFHRLVITQSLKLTEKSIGKSDGRCVQRAGTYSGWSVEPKTRTRHS